jgi:hypothetical protein
MHERANSVLFRLFRRRARRYIWSPALDFSHRSIVGALMTFGHH